MKTHIKDKPLVLVGSIAQNGTAQSAPAAFVLSLMAFSSLSAIITKELMSERNGPTATALAALETPVNQAFSDIDAHNSDATEVSADLAAAMQSVGLIAPATTENRFITSDEWGHEIELLAQSNEPQNRTDEALPLTGNSLEILSLSPLDAHTLGPAIQAQEWPADTRWFNGRPVRPARTLSMVVTAYSPDWRSCGDSADNITASLHHIETNAGKLVAADPRVLALGSMITVPGYDNNQIVPVLDKGGAIKSNRLDVLFPTHAQARKWGVRTLKVIVWEYADGAGKADWRKVRDSK